MTRDDVTLALFLERAFREQLIDARLAALAREWAETEADPPADPAMARLVWLSRQLRASYLKTAANALVGNLYSVPADKLRPGDEFALGGRRWRVIEQHPPTEDARGQRQVNGILRYELAGDGSGSQFVPEVRDYFQHIQTIVDPDSTV